MIKTSFTRATRLLFLWLGEATPGCASLGDDSGLSLGAPREQLSQTKLLIALIQPENGQKKKKEEEESLSNPAGYKPI